MSARVDQLLESVLQLPDEEKLELLSALTTAIEERGLRPFDEIWLEEIERRSAEYDAGKMTAAPWDEVKQRVHRKVFGDG